VALQASFIALGTFGLGSWVEKGNDITKTVLESGGASGDVGFMLHSIGADAAALVALLLLIVSFFAKIDGGVRAALFVFLDVVLQWVLAFVSFGVWAVGILHGLNAFLLFGLGMMAAATATRSIKGTTAATSRSGAPMAETV
jgi:hypothetical protein